MQVLWVNSISELFCVIISWVIFQLYHWADQSKSRILSLKILLFCVDSGTEIHLKFWSLSFLLLFANNPLFQKLLLPNFVHHFRIKFKVSDANWSSFLFEAQSSESAINIFAQWLKFLCECLVILKGPIIFEFMTL